MQAHQVNTIICILVEKRETLWNPRINPREKDSAKTVPHASRHARCGCGSIEKPASEETGFAENVLFANASGCS